MAVDGYMWFRQYNSPTQYEASESQIDKNIVNTKDTMWKTYQFDAALNGGKDKNPGLFEVEDFSFDIEQTLNIGSQSTGAGAGKVTFNPFSITRKIDRFSPTLYNYACSGTPFETVSLGLKKSAGGNTTGIIYLVFRFKLVAVKTVSWSYDDESPKETVTFEYGGLQVFYSPQKPDGSLAAEIGAGWNRVKNVSDVKPDPI